MGGRDGHKKQKSRWEQLKQITGKVNSSKITKNILEFADNFHPFGNALSSGNNIITASLARPPIQEQKQKIIELLENKKIIVIVDDMDRMETSEILDTFRLIKSIADFPNITYILSLDRDLVCKNLTDFQKSRGEAYLDKIIQHPIFLPIPSPETLINMISKKITRHLSDPMGVKFDNERWNELNYKYLRTQIRTPRQAVRLAQRPRPVAILWL